MVPRGFGMTVATSRYIEELKNDPRNWRDLYQQQWDMTPLWKMVDEAAKNDGTYHLPPRFRKGANPEVDEIYERAEELVRAGLATRTRTQDGYPILQLTTRGEEAARQGKS